MAETLLSSSALLRRNWADYAFESSLTQAQRKEAEDRVLRALAEGEETFYLLKTSDLDEGLLESFCADRVLPKAGDEGDDARILLRKGENMAVFLHAEDHLLFIARGEVGEAAKSVITMAQRLSAAGSYAHRQEYGYLTARPMYAGTGLHLCFRLHLPLLHMLHQVKGVAAALLKDRGYTLVSLDNEDGKNPAALYVLFNRRTQGADEASLIEGAREACAFVEGKETELRQRIFNGNHHTVYADQVFRAYGVLRYARRLGAVEFQALWSKLRLGACAGLLPLSMEDADRIFEQGRKSRLLKSHGDETGEKNLNFLRADMVRHELNGGH